MNILMVSNSYKPFVGGVERSIELFSHEFRCLGHEVLIVVPRFQDMHRERGVIRVPALQNFNGTDFSVPLPIPGRLTEALKRFKPQIVHSHHPFLLGDTAYRIAVKLQVPIVFTYHTFFELYTHYVPGDSEALKRFAAALATGYANMCTTVIAPSPSVAEELRKRGVERPVEIVPTGLDLKQYASGNRQIFRDGNRIPSEAFVAGIISRLASEKNVLFIAEAAASFLQRNISAHFVLVGTGPLADQVCAAFHRQGVADRLHVSGILNGRSLTDAYAALDLFVFASKTETQGMVLTESMAAGVPVLAIDAFAVRDVVEDLKNGRLLMNEDIEQFAATMEWFATLPEERRREMGAHARRSAAAYSKELCARKMIGIYEKNSGSAVEESISAWKSWEEAKRLIRAEWDLIANVAAATEAVFKGS